MIPRVALRLVMIAVVLSLFAASVPVIAAWTWTESNPLLFDFTNIEPAPPPFEYVDPWGQNPFIIWSNAPGIFMDSLSQNWDGTWYFTFSDPLGTLTIQNEDTNKKGRLLLSTGAGKTWTNPETSVQYTNEFSASKTGEELNWDKGIVLEVKATAIGARNGAPEGYDWAGNIDRGGVEFRFGSIGDGGAMIVLSWLTKDPTDQNDDVLSLANENSALAPLYEKSYPLGGTPTNAPANTYKITARKSPLPLSPTNSDILFNVYVDKGSGYERAITNVTIKSGASASDSITIGKRDNTKFDGWGNEYHWLKTYEADSSAWENDTTPPSKPGDFSGSAQGTQLINLSWDSSTDDGEVVGYRLKRGEEYIAVLPPEANSFMDSNREPDTTYTYSICAVDWNGNVSEWAGPITVTTLPSTTRVLTFNFADMGNTTIVQSSSPNWFKTYAEEDASYYLGGAKANNDDGRVFFDSTGNRYQYVFSDADGGSLTIQTNCVQNPATAPTRRSFAESATLGNFLRFMKVDDYPSPGKTLIMGSSMEADMEFVGDAQGWCAAWGDFPQMPGCTAVADMGHQASDWGTSWGPIGGLQLTLGQNLDLIEPGYPAGTGLTKGGVQYWVALNVNDIRNPADDFITMNTTVGNVAGTFQLLDPAGFALKAEDGTVNGCKDGQGVPYARDGVIQGNCNKMKVKIAIAPTGDWNGNNPYAHWDIWIKRPIDDDYIHINPMTATCLNGDWKHLFGDEGHTIKAQYYARDQGNKNHFKLGNQNHNMIWGMKFNQVKIRNDWSGVVIIDIKNLSELRKLGIGTRVSITPEGGEKIVTFDGNAFDYSGPYFFYIEQADRSAGIKVIDRYTIPAVFKGQQITNLDGVIVRDADGNLCLDVTDKNCEGDTATATIEPVGMNNITAAGKDASDGVGLANTGILATVWGEVSGVYTDDFGNVVFYIDDGSGTKIRAIDPAFDGTFITPVDGEYWTVTGPLAVWTDANDNLIRSIVVDTGRKIK